MNYANIHDQYNVQYTHTSSSAGITAGLLRELMQNQIDSGYKSKVDIARERFGQRFAHEPGATWKPRTVPVLTEWMQSRGKV